MLERYRDKIITLSKLLEVIGPYPRDEEHTVVACNGCFDLVHPGHIRHFVYAKQYAPVLVVILTADMHIKKGPNRPFVPQELRALNLAALELVDYVVINDSDRPDDLLKLLQPEVYAKGFEYDAANRSGRSIAEEAIIKSYGGETLYTPGDHVYSSSALINAEPPDIRVDKLKIVMDRYGVTFDDLRQCIEKMDKCFVHVIGDSIVDSYTKCSMIGGQTKTPTISVKYEERIDYVGGAGIVAKHMKAAGAAVVFSTVVGNDKLGEFVLDDISQFNIEVIPYVDPLRPTTNKNAIVVDDYRLLKVDTLDNRTISDEIVKSLADTIKAYHCEIVVFADFRHGIFNKRTIPSLIDSIPAHAYKVADSQVASRWGNILEFQGFDLITPNEREARFSLGDQDSGVRLLASELYDASKCKTLMLKLGERGMMVCLNSNHEDRDSFFVIDSFVKRVVDPVGAGDALLAYATLAMKVSNNPAIAAILGTFAAGIECEMDGNVPIQAQFVLNRIDEMERNVK